MKNRTVLLRFAIWWLLLVAGTVLSVSAQDSASGRPADQRYFGIEANYDEVYEPVGFAARYARGIFGVAFDVMLINDDRCLIDPHKAPVQYLSV